MASGKRAIAAGPENPPVVVDETADVARAARDLVFGASLDNNIICIVEKFAVATPSSSVRWSEQCRRSEALSSALMNHKDIRLLVVTGGGGATSAVKVRRDGSGKRAIAAGPGNPPVVVDETADVARAARDLVFGASLDNNIISSSKRRSLLSLTLPMRSSVRWHEQCRRSEGRDLRQLEKLLITADNHVNRDYIGKDAAVILADAGIRVPESTRLAFAEVDESHPFVQHEMLLPVLGFVRVPDVDQAIAAAVRCEHGYGHTAVMHSSNIHALHRMARASNTSIFLSKMRPVLPAQDSMAKALRPGRSRVRRAKG